MGTVAIKQFSTQPEGRRGGRNGGLSTIEVVVGAYSAHSTSLLAACVPVFLPDVYVLVEVGKSRRGAALVWAFSPHQCRTITPTQRDLCDGRAGSGAEFAVHSQLGSASDSQR